MLTVVHGNRLETLADRLLERIRIPAAPPLVPEDVVVPSGGMARWLSQRIARGFGVCANVRFRLPAVFLWDTFGAALPDVPRTSPVDPAVAAWHLAALLAELEDAPRFQPLHAYLCHADELARHDLARRLADTFDQYLVYRPTWIAAWEAGEDDGWQAELWRRLVARTTGRHRVRVATAFLQALRTGAVPANALPARLSLFGLSALPPAYLDLFARVAEHVDTHLFVLNPCREYWSDLTAPRDLPRRARREDPAALYLEVGHPLLASLGKQGQDFQDQLAESAGHVVELFEPPGEDTLLHALQDDVLALRDRRPAPGRDWADGSLQVHLCHGPMREVEVLHDQLLALFERHPDLTPADVVVMTPDIERYAPCVEAVFGAAPAARQIRFTIADRSLPAESGLVDGWLRLLDLPGSRYEASRLLALLEVAAVQRRFGLEPGDLEAIQRWIRESGVRWGVDRDARERLGLPSTEEHTWRFGLDRLLLGYALPGGGTEPFADILPYDDVEGGDAQVLGRLAAFVAAAAALDPALAAPRPPAAWATALAAMLDRFLDAGDDEAEAFQTVRGAVAALAEAAAAAGFEAPVSFALMRAEVRRALATSVAGGRFLAGAVTVCAMVPMRSLPFAVVCLLGLDDRSFPRAQRTPGFDLITQQPARGDRSRRADDRWLFLEALLSARRHLHLSYVGRSLRDNQPIPPSPLVSELLDYVQRRFGRPDVVTEHPLQAFSRRYFGADPGSGLFSYATELCEASRVRPRRDAPPRLLLDAPLPEPGDDWRRVRLADFLTFFINPTAYLLRRRLRIYVEADDDLMDDEEPFVLDGLGRYVLRQELLALQQQDPTLAQAWPLLRARGLLPHAVVGRVLIERERAVVAEFGARLARARSAEEIEPPAVALDLGPIRLDGVLTGVTRAGLVDHRLAKPRARDCLTLWIRHLLLHLVAPADVVRRSTWLGLDAELVLEPVDDPGAALAALAALYWRGLSRPLPLFPEAALAYCATTRRPLAAARDAWEGNEFHRGECDDAYYHLAFRETDPLGDEFVALAEAVFRPLLARLERGTSA